MSTRPRAVVLSSDVIGLGAVRSLCQGGVPTLAVTLNRWEPVRFSRYGEKRLVPKSEDLEGAILETLDGIPSEDQPVLLPTSEFLAHFVAQLRDALSQRFRCCIPSNAVMDLVLDKARDTQVIGDFGVALPKTVAVLPPTPRELIQRVGLPLIIKPRTYVDKRELGWRNVVAHRAEHVEDFYHAQASVFGRVIAQELIPGEDEALWECMCVFNGDSDLTSAFTFQKLRTIPAHYGQTSYGISERNQGVLSVARTIGKRLNYVGPADFDLKYDHRDGHYKYLELNPRLGLCNYFATQCGVNLALDAYRLASGAEVLAPAVQRDGVTFLSVLEDLGGRLHAGDSLPRVLFDLLVALGRRPVGAYFSRDDMWPGPATAVRLCYRLIERACRGQLREVWTKDYRDQPLASRTDDPAEPPPLPSRHALSDPAPAVPDRSAVVQRTYRR